MLPSLSHDEPVLSVLVHCQTALLLVGCKAASVVGHHAARTCSVAAGHYSPAADVQVSSCPRHAGHECAPLFLPSEIHRRGPWGWTTRRQYYTSVQVQHLVSMVARACGCLETHHCPVRGGWQQGDLICRPTQALSSEAEAQVSWACWLPPSHLSTTVPASTSSGCILATG